MRVGIRVVEQVHGITRGGLPGEHLNETVAVRLTTDECRALFELARAQDRTVSWVIRTQVRKLLREQQRAA